MVASAPNGRILPLRCPDIEHLIDQQTHVIRRERLHQESVCSQTDRFDGLRCGGVGGHEHDGGAALLLSNLAQQSKAAQSLHADIRHYQIKRKVSPGPVVT